MSGRTWAAAMVLGAVAGGLAGWWTGGAAGTSPRTEPAKASQQARSPARDALEKRVARLERALQAVRRQRTPAAVAADNGTEPATPDDARQPSDDSPRSRAEWEALRRVSETSSKSAGSSESPEPDPIEQLRGLTPADRWKQVARDLRLTDAQVEDLRTAIRNRDLALDDARVVSIIHLESGGRMRSVTLDPAAARAARAAFDDRLDFLLDADQRAAWTRRQLGKAFGEKPAPAILQPLAPGASDAEGGPSTHGSEPPR